MDHGSKRDREEQEDEKLNEQQKKKASEKLVVLDIEGTVTTLAFVKDVLFGYVRRHLDAFEDENVLNECKEQWKVNDVKKHALELMDKDSKDQSLKKLQSFIMEVGFGNGELKADVFEDAIKVSFFLSHLFL